MNIKSIKNYKLDNNDRLTGDTGEGRLQRTMVKLDCGSIARRIVATVNRDGGLSCILPSPWWQVQIHTGEFHNTSDAEARKWETAFQAFSEDKPE